MAGGMHPHPESIYFHIAKDSLNNAKSEKDLFAKKQMTATCLVFSALCLETFINQAYWKSLETRKILNANDNFPLLTKWLILPLLMGANVTFDKGSPPYQDFQKLISLRNNRLVHFKPDKERRVGEMEDCKDEYLLNLLEDVELCERYFLCVERMIKKLNELTNGRIGVPNFLSGLRTSGKVWNSI